MPVIVTLAAWALVAALSLLIAFNLDDDDNLILWFLPILVAAGVAAFLTQAAFSGAGEAGSGDDRDPQGRR